MDEMMKALKGKTMPVEGKEKNSKMEVLKELIQQMAMLMADEGHLEKPPMEGMPMQEGAKVEVEAGSPEQLEKGLDMAKQVVGKADGMPMENEEDLDEEYF